MKKIKLIFLFILTIITMITISGCSDAIYEIDDKAYCADDVGLKGEYGELNNNTSGENEDSDEVSPKTLTAKTIFDFEHYAFWQSLKDNTQNGIFANYDVQNIFNTKYMIKLNFNTDTKIKVTLLNDGQKEVFSTYSTAFKTAYLFAKTMQDTYQVRLEYKNINGEQVTKIMEVKNDDLIEIDNVAVKQDMIDLMIVLDTTGSMNDEIKFLKAELMDICNKIKLANPNTILRLALLYYKDTKDEYITKYADFTTDIEEQINNLSSITASGGGDFEEAVEVAMSEASQKTWNEAATKILIHIADAPAHEKDITKWEEAISNIASLGINIITVAASGIDKLTEYYFRSEALLTSGAYVWLTDDSGVGESHTEATVETEVTIEYLNSLLIRLINGYHLGTLEEAIYWRQDV